MSRSFLASLRGADARSVARALALLLLFNGVFGAFHSSAMANGALGEAILCGSAEKLPASEGLPNAPSTFEELACCVLGAGPSPAAIAAEPAPLPLRPFAQIRSEPFLFDTVLPERRYPGSASPRGPPSLA